MARANLGNLLSVASDQGIDESGVMAKKPEASIEAPKKPRQDKNTSRPQPARPPDQQQGPLRQLRIGRTTSALRPDSARTRWNSSTSGHAA